MNNQIKIKNKFIGENHPVFIVAEIGVNHNQKKELAKKLIKSAKESGADAVKFQTWKTENICLKDAPMAEYQIKNTGINVNQFDMLKTLELPYAWHKELKEYAENLNMIFFSTAEDEESIDFLIKEVKIEILKVGSGELTNYPLLSFTAKKKVPLIISTGMSNLCDIEKALDVIYKNKNEDIIICQCTSQYPAPIVDINLKAINTLKNTFKLPSGFSDHSIGDECSIAAVALGAVYIERHFTLDRNLPGPDHKASLEPNEFKKMVIKIRNIEKALGNGIKKLMPSEIDTKNVVMRRIVASKDINLGEKINLSSVNFKKSNIGLESKDFDYIDGKTIKKSIKKNMVITNEYF